MTHAEALRLIGQSLEAVKLQAFDLETVGPNYVVRSKFLTKAGEWIFRHTFNVNVAQQDGGESTSLRSVTFSPADLARLDNRGQKQDTSRDTEDHSRLSGLLHTLGNHLDRARAKEFQISWMHDSASVDYQFADGQSDSRIFSAAKLEQIGSLSRFGTLGRTRFTSKSA